MSHVFASETVTARKPHGCQQCGRSIIKGERYGRTTSVDYFGWNTFVSCPQCDACASDLWDIEVRAENEDGDECYAYLPEVDWHDVSKWSPIWQLRAERFNQQWAGLPYPEEA